jgi:hypothetical protein
MPGLLKLRSRVEGGVGCRIAITELNLYTTLGRRPLLRRGPG